MIKFLNFNNLNKSFTQKIFSTQNKKYIFLFYKYKSFNINTLDISEIKKSKIFHFII